MELKITEELGNKRIEEFGLTEKSLKYLKRKGVNTGYDFVDLDEDSFCSTPAAKRSYVELKVKIAMILLNVVEVE